MLHKVKTSHGDILKGLPELAALLPSSVRKKKLLLEMARRGEPRPHVKRHPLGSSLSHYTRKKTSSYSPEFDREIRRLRPDWFVNQTEKANGKIQMLLDMAEQGKPRPKFTTRLGQALSTYTRKKSLTYSLSFDRKIRKLAPHWFVTRSNLADEKKRQLLELARKKGLRPDKKSPLGKALPTYTYKAHSAYDPVFDKKIRKLAPHWFKRCSTR